MHALSGRSSVDCSSVICKDDIPDNRVDLRCPAPPAENPVVTNSSLHVMAFHVRLEPAAQLVRRGGLTNGADIVALPFDGEQCGAPNGAQIDALGPPNERHAHTAARSAARCTRGFRTCARHCR